MNSNTSRRQFLAAAAMAPVAGTVMAAATQATPAAGGAAAFAFDHQPVPLPYRPGKLDGLSERLVQSHWENNYVGAVKALAVVRGRLQQAMADTSLPPYVYNGLKREQLFRTGSVVLHELYFGSLGGDGKAGAAVRSRIAGSFGSYDAWETEFRRIGNGLGGGSGWVVLGYNQHLKLLENYWMADHSTAPATTTPLLVMDMYEHAYQMDYGAAAAKYIDAFFNNINWEAVEQRA